MTLYLHTCSFELQRHCLLKIGNDSAVIGFRLWRVKIKLTAYVDDITFFVKDFHSLYRLLKLLEIFQVFASEKFNVNICKTLWNESIKTRRLKPVR